MEEEKIFKAYYAVIPANVRYDEDLTPNAKLLYGEITALCNEKGFCWASNEYFATLYKVSKRNVARWVNQLIHKGLIFSEMNDKKNMRILKLSNESVKDYVAKCHGGMTKMSWGYDKNVTPYNNNNNNNNNNKEIREKAKEFVPPTLEEVKEYAREKKRLDLAEKFYEYFTVGNWRDSKGDKVKNWKQKFLTWCGKDKQVLDKAKSNFSTKRNYTDEECNALFQNIDDVQI